jgi:hypothetical protein
MRNPLRTKKMSTPMKPPWNQGMCEWMRMTEMMATPRSPSSAGT